MGTEVASSSVRVALSEREGTAIDTTVPVENVNDGGETNAVAAHDVDVSEVEQENPSTDEATVASQDAQTPSDQTSTPSAAEPSTSGYGIPATDTDGSASSVSATDGEGKGHCSIEIPAIFMRLLQNQRSKGGSIFPSSLLCVNAYTRMRTIGMGHACSLPNAPDDDTQACRTVPLLLVTTLTQDECICTCAYSGAHDHGD